jgi:tetrahydromethanopterin S-methyltransferase subunit G
LEQTLPDLQAQIDQLSLALRQWRETQDTLLPMEQRLSALTERCAEILNRWSEHDQRHGDALKQLEGKLNDWSAIEQRLEQDSLQRIREFEGTIEHEWSQLRQMHAEPVKQLREQTATLGETCVAAANLALRGFERAESRFAALEADLQERLSQLSHDVQTAIADLKHDRPALKPAPFPLEGVMRIHEEMRDSTGDAAAALPAAPAAPPPVETPAEPDAKPAAQLPEAAAALTVRMESLEREVTHTNQEVRDSVSKAEQMQRGWRLLFGIAAGAIVIAAFIGLNVMSRVNARLNDAATRVSAAEKQAQAASNAATKEIASTRAEADKQIAEAHATALRAQIVSNVLAAPDLVRFSLGSADAASRASAQVLWSRSRGMVVSTSRLAAAPAGSAYQVWLLSTGAPIGVGTISPDAAGRATLSLDTLPDLPPVVTGIIVTLEPAAGSAAPSGAVVLTRRAPQ